MSVLKNYANTPEETVSFVDSNFSIIDLKS